MEYNSFCEAIKGNDVDKVRSLLNAGFNPDKAHGYPSQPPICLAVKEGNADIVKLLVMGGADVLRETTAGDSALHLAIQIGRVDLMDMLVRAGAEVNMSNSVSCRIPPLNMAVKSKQPDAVRYLIQAGADVNAIGSRQHNRNTALHMSTMFEEPEILNELLGANSHINCTNDEKSTPLHTASIRGYDFHVKRLIDCGAVVDALDSEGFTPLMVAVRRGHLEVVKHLCVAGASLNIASNAGQTPLNLAISHGHVAVIKMLLRFNADVNKVADYTSSRYPIHVAVRSCIHRSKGNRCRHKNQRVMSVNKEIEVLDSLLQSGAELDCVDKNGLTALHHSITNSCEAVTEYLIKAGSDYVIVDEDGNTPLFLACDEANSAPGANGSVVHLLVSLCPALLSHPMHSCLVPHIKSPFVVTAQRCNKRLLQLLMEAGYRCTQREIDICLDDQRISDEVRRWIRQVIYQPWPLERIAKVKVRNMLSSRIHSKVYKIHIPQKLREFILLKNIQFRV